MTFDLQALFQAALAEQSLLLIALSFVGGVASTLLPCTIAMLPILVGYMGGYAETSNKWDVLIQVILFVVGLSIIMTLLGLIAGVMGITFGAWAGSWWYYGAAAIAILMGLVLLDILHFPFPQFIKQLPESGTGKQGVARYIAPILLGMAFGAASSPCGTPFLAGIIVLISQVKNFLLGGASLFAYALGQGVLLVTVGLFTGLLKHQAQLQRVGTVITKMSAIVFILAGIILILEGSGVLADWLIQLGLL